ncbi:MAG: hypothetical protein HC817_14895 [Saprospiraceae bacterium]|nr:hypothetical protein [Saprospiraceae bacterium]
MINSTKKSIEQFYCDESGRWQIGEALNEGSLTLFSMPIELSFEEVYANVVFEEKSEKSAEE